MARYWVETPTVANSAEQGGNDPFPGLAQKSWPSHSGLLALLLALLVLTGCSPTSLLNALAPDKGISRQSAIRYGPADRQLLDLYLPERGLAGSPVLVFFYGGSWRRGERENYRYIGYNLAAKGYVTVIPDYRVYPQVRFPKFVEDGARALAWVARNVDGASNGVVVIGHSAGAHIAALLALDRRYLQREKSSVKLLGMIGLAGPYAFDPLAYDRVRPIFSNLANPDRARPVTFACTQAPPLLLLHGRDDTTVVPDNTAKLAAEARACGNRVETLFVEDVGHIGILLALTQTFDGLAEIRPRIDTFLKTLSVDPLSPAP